MSVKCPSRSHPLRPARSCPDGPFGQGRPVSGGTRAAPATVCAHRSQLAAVVERVVDHVTGSITSGARGWRSGRARGRPSAGRGNARASFGSGLSRRRPAVSWQGPCPWPFPRRLRAAPRTRPPSKPPRRDLHTHAGSAGERRDASSPDDERASGIERAHPRLVRCRLGVYLRVSAVRAVAGR